MGGTYNGPEGKAKPAEYAGFAVGETLRPNIGSVPEAIRKTCIGCNNIFDGKCEGLGSGRIGVSIRDSSPRCHKYKSL